MDFFNLEEMGAEVILHRGLLVHKLEVLVRQILEVEEELVSDLPVKQQLVEQAVQEL